MQEQLQNIYLKDTKNEKLFGMPNEYDYSRFSNLEDFTLDEELKAKFLPIAKKLNLSQESVEMLLDIALEMSRKQKSMYDKDEETKLENNLAKYNQLFKEDNEIPSNSSIKLREYMTVASDAYSQFASPKLKEIFSELGLIYHPELIKMFYKIGDLALEDNLSYNGKPVQEELTPAQILYGTRE